MCQAASHIKVPICVCQFTHMENSSHEWLLLISGSQLKNAFSPDRHPLCILCNYYIHPSLFYFLSQKSVLFSSKSIVICHFFFKFSSVENKLLKVRKTLGVYVILFSVSGTVPAIKDILNNYFFNT